MMALYGYCIQPNVHIKILHDFYVLDCLNSCNLYEFKVWNKAFNCERILGGHKGPVKALVKLGDFVFSGGDDGYIKLWSTHDGSEFATIAAFVGVSSLALATVTLPTATNTNSNTSESPILLSGHTDGVIKVNSPSDHTK
jgi:WD40 repeat protein